MVAGRSDEAVAVIESAIPAIEPVDRELALLMEADLAAHARQAGTEARDRAARRLARLADLGRDTPGKRLVHASRAFDLARGSESAAEAVTHLEGALADGQLLAEQEVIPGPFYHLVFGLLATDALDTAAACVAKALQIAHTRTAIAAVAFFTACRGRIALRRGALAQAEADGRAALEQLEAHGIRSGRIFVTFVSALTVETLIETGDLETAEQMQQGGGPTYLPTGLTNNDLFRARCLLRLAQGHTGEGLAGLVEFGRRDEECGAGNPLASRWRSHAALALAHLGNRAEARRMAAEDLARARRWGTASGTGIALRAAALVGEASGAVELLTQATRVLAGSPARLEHARALTDLGAALRRANRRVDARRPLREGLRLAQRCSARPLVDLARTELRAAGGRSAGPPGSGAAQLTVSERRVAELAAEGRSNREIAQALFVTTKTVETHLGHAYLKLNIARRAQLNHALAASAELD